MYNKYNKYNKSKYTHIRVTKDIRRNLKQLALNRDISMMELLRRLLK